MANSQDDGSSQHPDLLAAVVLHTLVSEAREGMSAAAIAVACDRDPRIERDVDEIAVALAILLEDGLAERGATSRSEPDAPRASGSARALDNVRTPDKTQEPDVGPQTLYRPTRAAIRAHELSF